MIPDNAIVVAKLPLRMKNSFWLNAEGTEKSRYLSFFLGLISLLCGVVYHI